MSEQVPYCFLVPTPWLGVVEDVRPDKVSAAYNDWIDHSHEILDKKREAAQKGQWMPTSEISEDHKFLRPFGAQACPALQEMSNIGYVLKWPQNAVLKREGPRAWKLETYGDHPAYKYHGMSSFPEAGISDVMSISLGWIAVGAPGWSVLIKNVPNNLGHEELGISFAEGTIRVDQATISMQVHAFILPSAPDKIVIERGKPMCLVMPFIRESVEMRVLSDDASREAAWSQADKDHQTFANAPGKYRELFINDFNPSPLYPKFKQSADEEPKE